MYATLLANLVNIILNYALIFGQFGFPKLGIVGAAYGTLISRCMMLLCIWILLSRNEKSKTFISDFKIFVLNKMMLKKILSLGTPSAMQITSMIRVGNQKGLENYRELRRIAMSIFLLALILATFFAILFFTFRHQLPKVYVDFDDVTNFKDNLEVVNIATQLLFIAAIFQISDSIQVVVLGALRGLQDVKIPTLITFIAYWAVGFPISYFFGKGDSLGSFGIWLGLLAGLSTASVLLFIRFHYLTTKLIREKRE
jgi:MATE family multidrug resistance protein